MARRYARDNRGRFASSGSGATARGGRLKTASGNKRQSQTMQAKGGPKGTIGKPKGLKPGAIQTRAAAKPVAKAGAKRSKTDLQVMQQADRLMGKLAKRQASINVGKVGLNEGLRQVRRNNARAGRVNAALNSRGLLGKYNKLTAPADPIHMTPAGPGIKPASKRKAVGSISDAKAGRIIGRIDANRPGIRRASGSARKTANSIKTHRKATDFALAAGARARKQGKNLSVNDSLRRAVANAAKKRRR